MIVVLNAKIRRLTPTKRYLRHTGIATSRSLRTASTPPSYCAIPSKHWRRLRTGNPLERLILEIRRQTRAADVLQDDQSALMLVATRLRHVAATKRGRERYLQMNRLAGLRLSPAPLCFRPDRGQRQSTPTRQPFSVISRLETVIRFWTLPTESVRFLHRVIICRFPPCRN